VANLQYQQATTLHAELFERMNLIAEGEKTEEKKTEKCIKIHLRIK
jgi:hypothetical protein